MLVLVVITRNVAKQTDGLRQKSKDPTASRMKNETELQYIVECTSSILLNRSLDTSCTQRVARLVIYATLFPGTSGGCNGMQGATRACP